MSSVVAVGGTAGIGLPRAATVAEALRSGAELVWLLAPGGEPAPDALELLREALGTSPLAAGLVTDAAGRPADRFHPRGKQLDIELLLASASDRRMPARYALAGNTLVRAGAADGPPDPRYGPYAMQEWTARLLGGGFAWLVPGSVVRLAPGEPAGGASERGLRDAAAVVRMARTGAWSRGELMRAVAALRPGRGPRRPGRPGPSGG